MLLIFDWDGTLSDSADKIINCMQQAAIDTGYRICERDAVRNIIGLGLPEALHALYPELTESERKQLRQAYVDCFLSVDQKPSPFFDGVLEGLHLLRDKGFTMAVATGKSRRGLDRVFENLGMQHFFHASRCADETASKPNPLMLQELLGELKVVAGEAVMVGDTEYDLEMAWQLSMPSVAVSYGAHRVQRLQPYQPVLTADHFSEFVDWVLKR